jgi:hypothetical protein
MASRAHDRRVDALGPAEISSAMRRDGSVSLAERRVLEVSDPTRGCEDVTVARLIGDGCSMP